jgi:hypothetical protein
MLRLWIGIIGFIISVGLLWYFLPRQGKTHRLVGTLLEPYIAVAVCGGIGLSCTLILAAVVDLIGATP